MYHTFKTENKFTIRKEMKIIWSPLIHRQTHHILIYFLPVFIFFLCLSKMSITLMSRPFGWEGRCCVESGFGSLERGWNLAVGSPSWGSCHAWGYIRHSRPPIFLENKIVLFCPAHLGPDSGSDKTEAAKEWKHQNWDHFRKIWPHCH